MIKSEKQIYIEETQVKPNKLAVRTLLFVLGISWICWIANELEVFHVDNMLMRLGTLILTVAIVIPVLYVTLDKRRYSYNNTKYFMLSACFVCTFTMTALLLIHAELLLVLPIIFAMFYRSKLLGKLALAASIICTVFSPVVGYMLGAWDVSMLAGNIEIATGGTVQIIDPTYAFRWESVVSILLYFVLPKLMLLSPCVIIMFYVINIGTDHIKSEVLLNRINHCDTLTGLYNQNYYKEYLSSHEKAGNVGVIFFDVNGLKDINDMDGHERGDLLLKRCAESIAAVCDDSHSFAFRVGGDEFIMIIEGASEPDVIGKISRWKEALEKVNDENKRSYGRLKCSMAAGHAVGDFSDFDAVASRADSVMYRNKTLMKSGRMLS